MAKKKIDDPFFLTFINLPILVWPDDPDDPDGSMLFPDGYEKKEVYINYHKEFKAEIITAIKERLEKGNLSRDHINKLRILLDRFYSLFSDNELRKFNREYANLRMLIDLLMSDPALLRNKRISNLKDKEIYDYMVKKYSTTLKLSYPALHRDSDGRFHFSLEPIGVKGGIAAGSAIYGLMGIEFTQFLVDHYKPGIFEYCKLEGCEQIIITANGRKYCCPYHRKKASKLKIEKNKNKLKRNRIRDRLRKQFERNPFEKNREKYIKNHWPKKEIDLYHEPYSANK